MFSLFGLLLKFLSLNKQKQIVNKKVKASDMLKLIFFSLCSLSLIIPSLWLGKLYFWPQTRAVIKQLSEFCVGGSGWQAQSGKWQTHQTARREACCPPASDCHTPSHEKESICLIAVSQPLRQAGMYLMDSIDYILIRLNKNNLWNKWPICAFGISPIKQLFYCWLVKFINI